METYLTIGKILQEEKNYSRAVVAFKMLLLIAWQENSSDFEMLAYENLAMQFFHLNDNMRATYYHQRADHGLIEPQHSSTRLMALEIRRQEKAL